MSPRQPRPQGKQNHVFRGFGALEASRVNLSERGLGRVARRGCHLVVIFAIVNVRLRLSLLRREAKQLSQDVLRLTTWAEDRRLSQLDSATKKDEQTQVAA